jgi:hypothetical protein
MLTIISKPVTVCGVNYVDVQTEHGVNTMLESKVKLIHKLMEEGLTEEDAKAIVNGEISEYARQLELENQID